MRVGDKIRILVDLLQCTPYHKGDLVTITDIGTGSSKHILTINNKWLLHSGDLGTGFELVPNMCPLVNQLDDALAELYDTTKLPKPNFLYQKDPISTIDPNYDKPKDEYQGIDLDFEDYECWQQYGRKV